MFNPRRGARKRTKRREEKEMEEKIIITFNKLLRDRLQRLPGFHSGCTNVHIPTHNPLPKDYYLNLEEKSAEVSKYCGPVFTEICSFPLL